MTPTCKRLLEYLAEHQDDDPVKRGCRGQAIGFALFPTVKRYGDCKRNSPQGAGYVGACYARRVEIRTGFVESFQPRYHGRTIDTALHFRLTAKGAAALAAAKGHEDA